MDYSGIRFKAVVDWIEFEIHTDKPTNFQTVQRALREFQNLPAEVNPHVKALNESAGGSADTFIFRIQDPERLCDLKNLLNTFAYGAWRIETNRVTAIEIALDTYDAKPEQAARFYKFATHIADDKNHRLYRKSKIDKVLATPHNFESLVKHLAAGWQIGIGNRNDDLYQHIYFKTTDNGGAALDQAEHRARIEITLRGVALPCKALDDWQDFNFATLSRFFQFRELKAGLNLLQQATADASAQIGERRTRNRCEGGIRLHSKLTRADTALNARARDALRELSRRWQGTPKRSTKQTTPAPSQNMLACGNTGELKAANPHECLQEGAGSNNYTTDLITNTGNHGGTEQRDAPRLPNARCASRLTKNADANAAQHVEAASLDELFNLAPEVEAEQSRIDRLIDGDDIGWPPSPRTSKS